MNKISVLCIAAAVTAACVSCEFSFGTKQEPVHHGVADPGVKIHKRYTPEKIAEIMTEDLSDKGWKATPAKIDVSRNGIEKSISSVPFGNSFAGSAPKAVIVIPYIKMHHPKTSVTLTFFDLETPFGAFSVFSRARQNKTYTCYYGERECLVSKKSSVFWEGPFLISVDTANLGEDTRDVILGVSKGIAYKLYGLIGTYEEPQIAGLFPSSDMKDHSVQVCAHDPFQLKKSRICMKAEYSHMTGTRELYLISDESREHLEAYRRLLVNAVMDPGSAILASENNKRTGSRIWINSHKYGIVEISCSDDILAVETGIGAFQNGISRAPGLKSVALSGLIHQNHNKGVDINPYKNLLIIENPGKPSAIIPMGSTLQAVRNAE